MTIDYVTVVLFDRDDAYNFAPVDGVNYKIVALTPSAAEGARARNPSLPAASSGFSDRDQIRCVIAGRKALNQVDRSSILSTLSPSVRLMVRQSLWQVAFLEQRVRRTLPRGAWLIRNKDGVWTVARDRHSMLRILLPRIWDYGLAHKVAAGRPPAAAVFRWLQRRVARSVARKNRVLVASVTHKLRSGWRQAITEAGADLVILQPTKGFWRDYRGFLIKPGNTPVLKVPPLSIGNARVRRALKQLSHISATIDDPYLAFAWSLYIPYLSKIIPSMLALADEGGRLLKLMGVRAVFGFEANSWLSAALNEAAGRVNVQRVVLNHNSQPPSGSAAADDILSTLFRQRTFNELVDVAGIWAPSALKWSSNAPHLSVRCQKVRVEYPTADNTLIADKPFRILHAGNYQNWSDYFPWVSETSEEFLHGMERLAEAASTVDRIELIFRLRPKREVDTETLRRSITLHPHIRISDTEDNFLEQLADSDLLIAHFSTTVEQALQMGKPVLLWGSTQRYRQFEGRGAFPKGKSRAQVYVVNREQDLAEMICAIRDAHYGQPLTDEESRCYRHPLEAPSLKDWTRALLNSDWQL